MRRGFGLAWHWAFRASPYLQPASSLLTAFVCQSGCENLRSASVAALYLTQEQ